MGLGDASSYVNNVHISDNLAIPVASVRNLTKKLWCIFPPESEGGGFFGVDEDGEVVLRSNGSSYWFDPKRGNFGRCQLPSFSITPQQYMTNNNHLLPTVATVRSHIDPPSVERSVRAKVVELQAQLQSLPVEVLMELADSGAIDNFPVSSQQIKHYSVQNVPYIQGNITKSSLWKKSGENDEDDDEACEAGDEVAMDEGGPISPPTISGADSIMAYKDKVTKYGFIIIAKHKKTEDLNMYHNIANNHYKLHGHRIRRLKQDALPAAMTVSAQLAAMEQQIDLRFKSPHQHEGADEEFIKTLFKAIVVAFAWATWMPRAYWGFAARRENMVYNLRLAPGFNNMTRQEAFTGIKPNFELLPIGRFGAPYLILIDKSAIQWKFGEHGMFAAYLCPDMQSKDVHFFLRWDTKRVCRRRSYRALEFVPDKWADIQVDKELRINFEDKDDMEAWNVNNMFVEKVLEGRITRSKRNDAAPIDLLEAIESSGSSHSLPHDSTDALDERRFLTSNVGNKIRLLSQGAPTGGASAQMDFDCEEVDVNGPIPASDEMRRDLDLDNDRTSECDVVNNKRTSEARSDGSCADSDVDDTEDRRTKRSNTNNSVRDNTLNFIKYNSPVSSFQMPNSVRLALPVSPTLSKVKVVETARMLRKAGVTEAEYVQKLYNETAEKIASEDASESAIDSSSSSSTSAATSESAVPLLPRWIRRKMILALRKVEKKERKGKKSRQDNPTVNMALDRTDWAEWIEAIDKEFWTLEDGGQWEIIHNISDIPVGQQILPSHIVLVQKRDSRGSPTKKKGRLVVGGNHQDSALLEAVSSPTCKSASVKMLFSIAAKQGLNVRMADVKAAYTKAVLPEGEDIYLVLPPRPKIIDGKKVLDKTKVYVKLKRSLYGLKQAGLLWNQLITEKLLAYGCKQLESDECLFTYQDSNGDTVNIALYVDDILFCSTNNQIVDDILSYLTEQFGEVNEVTDGASHLGLFIEHLMDGSIKLSQPGYILKILRELKMEHLLGTITYATPLDPAGEPKRMDTTPTDINEYRKIIGLLMHAAIHTRPDILYAVSYLATKLSQPTVYYRKQALRVVSYLAGTPTLGLTFSAKGPIELFGFVDASYLTHDDAKGHSGWSFSLSEHDAGFYSKSSKQKLVSRSSTEAEIQALDMAVVDAEWLRFLMTELGYTPSNPTIIFQDNTSCIQIAEGTAAPSLRTRHYAMRYFYVKQALEEHSVILKYLATQDHTADILTKQPATKQLFLALRAKLMNCANTESGLLNNELHDY